ncbi:MAG TPA: metallophosphoesterase, partial [Treponemataceae bacterium]|nr:metallophosphoesterase [Treponemataceae bacterium]
MSAFRISGYTEPDFMKHKRLFAHLISLLAVITLMVSCAHTRAHGVNRIRHEDLAIPDLPNHCDDYKIAFISDIHYGNNFSRTRMERLVESVNAQKSDLIILGGDLTRGTQDIKEFALLAGGFSAPHGVLAVLGNHDFYNGRSETVRALRKQGIIVLDETLIETPAGVTVTGINDLRDIYPVTGRLRDILREDRVNILVSHNPDYAEEGDTAPFDLILSGHTHGGQITIFGWAPVIPSRYCQKFRTGTVYTRGKPVIISNGAGYSGEVVHFRFFAPSAYLIIT